MTQTPLALLRTWIDEAHDAGHKPPATMTLATVDLSGQPSTRTMTLRDITDTHLAFITTLYTRKATDIADNPKVSILFGWDDLGRQVHIAGHAGIADPTLADELFAKKNRAGQLHLHASHQGSPINSTDEIATNIQNLDKNFGDRPIPRPHDWGVITVIPHTVEFWQRQPAGLHDRHLYRHTKGTWHASRLAP